MRFFVYFDAYGCAGQIIDEYELAERYQNDPACFLKAMSRLRPGAPRRHTSGHVGTFSFSSIIELNDYLDSLGDEISGFYRCRSQSRPYNF